MKRFTIPMENGKIAQYAQRDSGIYVGTIWDRAGDVESTTVCCTVAEIQNWVYEHDKKEEKND